MLESKSIQRYNKMKSLGCQFPDSFQNEDVDFDSINVCFVSFFNIRAYHWLRISLITNYFRISTELKKLSSTGVMRLHQIAIKFTNIKSFDGTEEMKKRLMRSRKEPKIELDAEKRAFMPKHFRYHLDKNIFLLPSPFVIRYNLYL